MLPLADDQHGATRKHANATSVARHLHIGIREVVKVHRLIDSCDGINKLIGLLQPEASFLPPPDAHW